MTTVAEMIEWLKTLPQDAIVKCGKEVQQGYERYMTYDDVDISCCDVFDFTDEVMMNPKYTGKVVVVIRAE